MSEHEKKTLFFVKSPEYKLTALETYLKKRKYLVYIESDIKDALLLMIEVQPDFLFIALDHSNAKIASLPQIANQSILTHIIPFTHSSAREDMRKLDYSRFAHKIFPPMSGPAIERMIAKIERENMLEETSYLEKKLDKVKVEKSKDEMRLIKSKAVENYELVKSTATIENEDIKKAKRSSFIIQKGVRSVQLKTKNDFFSQAKKTPMSDEKIANLHNEYETKIKLDLADMIETYQPEPLTGLPPSENLVKKAYCLLIQSEAWCGYLVTMSNLRIDAQVLEPIFKNWVAHYFKDLDEEDSSDFYEIDIKSTEFKSWIKSRSEYYEILNQNDSELAMGFIGIDPADLYIAYDDQNDLIGVPLDVIPVDTDLEFSLHLHLPENKKYLLYTPVNQKLSIHQKQRLLDKKIEKLFIPAEFEHEIRNIKVKGYLQALFEEIKSETSA